MRLPAMSLSLLLCAVPGIAGAGICTQTEFKYYARGIGTFLETNPDTGEVTQLTDCNFDRRCRNLPKP